MGLDGSTAVIHITSLEQFKEIINGTQNNVIVDFWASWCGPCRVISPYFQKLATEAPDHVGLYKVNIDEVADVAKEFKIKAIPTFMRFKGGQMVAEVTGADRSAVKALVSKAAQDDDFKVEEGKKVAEVTGLEGEPEVLDDILLSHAAQDDDMKIEKQSSEFKM